MTLNLKEYQRFEKQIILKKVGISGQKKGKIKTKPSSRNEVSFYFGLNVHWNDWHKAIDHLNYIGINYHEKPKVEIKSKDKAYASFSMKDPSGNILKFSSFSV